MYKSTNHSLFWIIALFTFFHVVTSSTLGLGDDEAYYWQWSQHLSLSYYDHPPLVAYLIAITTHIFGNNSFGVRFFNLISLPLVSLLIYKITLYFNPDPKQGTLTVFLFNLLPIILLGSLLIAPDTPMLFCYVVSLYCFMQIIYKNKFYYWYLLGITAGIGLLSKYVMVFIYLAVFLYLIVDKKQTHWFKDKRPYLAFLISLLIFSPVIIWNAKHHWCSFTFQFYTRHNHSLHPNWISFTSFLGAQFLLASPIFFVTYLLLIAKNYSKPEIWLLLCFSLPSLVIFSLVSLFTATKPTWAILNFIGVPLILVVWGNKYRKTLQWGIITSLFIVIFATIQSYYPIIRIPPLKNDITNDFYGWDMAGLAVNSFMQANDKANNWFIFSHNYQMASQLAYALKNKYPVNSLSDNMEEYYFWQNEAQLIGKNALFVTTNFYQLDPSTKYNCQKWQLYETLNVKRADLIVRQIYIYECFNYQGRKHAYSIKI